MRFIRKLNLALLLGHSLYKTYSFSIVTTVTRTPLHATCAAHHLSFYENYFSTDEFGDVVFNGGLWPVLALTLTHFHISEFLFLTVACGDEGGGEPSGYVDAMAGIGALAVSEHMSVGLCASDCLTR